MTPDQTEQPANVETRPAHSAVAERRTCYWLSSLVLVIVILHFGRVVLMPFVLAVLLTLVLVPAATWLQRRRTGRLAAVIIIMSIGLATTLSLGWMVEQRMADIASRWAEYKQSIRAKSSALVEWSDQLEKYQNEIRETLSGGVASGTPTNAPGEEFDPRRASQPSSAPIPVRIVPEKHSLLRVFCECTHPMYGKPQPGRRVYGCGQYERNGGCHHNVVDAEALLAFTLTYLKQAMLAHGGRAALRRELEALAARTQPQPNPVANQVVAWAKRIANLEVELALIQKNMARAKDESTSKAIEAEYLTQQKTVEILRQQHTELAAQSQRQTSTPSPMDHAEHALAIYDQITAALKTTASRQQIVTLIKSLNIRLSLKFTDAIKARRERYVF